MVVTLGAQEQLGAADFEVEAGGVITGRITDQWGAAKENVQISVTRLFRTLLPLSVGRTGGSPTDQTYSYSRVSAFTSIRKALRVS